MINSDVFHWKFTDDWEEQASIGWDATHKHFAKEFNKIGCASQGGIQ